MRVDDDEAGPNWAPLLALVGVELARWFMYSGEIELDDGARVHVYKHRDTRRSVHVGEDGRAFYYDWDGKSVSEEEPDYVEMSREQAIWGACRGWPRLEHGVPDRVRVNELVDRSVQRARSGDPYPVDPRELMLQREYEAEQVPAVAAGADELKVHEEEHDDEERKAA